MTFLALGSADLLYGNTVDLIVFQIFMKLFVDAVIFVVGKLNLGFAVTIHTPAHAEIRMLINFVHLLDLTMTGLTLDLSGTYVL